MSSWLTTRMMMLDNVFTKVLYEKRRSILLWSLTMFITNIAIALLFPSIRDTMGAMIGSVPASMQNWFGSAMTWQTYTGYAGQELFGEMSIILMIMSILFGANFLAGYEGNGTLLTLLTKPISRRRVYWQKYAAFVAALLFVSVIYYAGAIVGGWLMGEAVDYQLFAKCMLMVFLLALALGSITYSIGGITGRSGLSGILVGLYAFVAYLLFSLSTAASLVDKISYISLFRYSSAPNVIANGLNIKHILILIVLTLASVLVAESIFVRRDMRAL